MGVRGLQTFVEKSVPDACRKVYIVEMARQHSIMYNCQPVLLIDGMSLLRKIYGKELEWVFGGQWRQFVAYLKHFCLKFLRERIKLIFFFDGSVCNFKRSEWASRRIRKYNEILSVFKYINENHLQPSSENFQLPASMGSLTRFAIKYLCEVEVYTSILEADQEIADYAKQHNEVFGILSQDSDFMIFDTKPYLSATHLDIENLTTVMYDRNVLAQHIGLNIRQLPLLSCLVGNDVINIDELRSFHRRIFSSRDSFIPTVASFILFYQWTGDHHNDAEVCSIAQTVFGNESKMELITEALEVYSLDVDNLYIVHQRRHLESTSNGIPIEILDCARKRHINCTHLPPIYTLLINQEYESSELMEDPHNQWMQPAAIVYKSLRQRMYSVLLGGSSQKSLRSHRHQEPKGQNRIVIKEWCAYAGNPLTHPEIVELLPVKLKGVELNLFQLWSDKRDDETNFIRIEAFLACLQNKFSAKDFFSVNSRYICLCCIINYLLLWNKHPFLENWEVNAFLAQAVSPLVKMIQSLELLQVNYVDGRAVQLASLFMRGVSIVASLLCVCGFPIPLECAMPWNYFDGKLFHHLYLQAKNGTPVESLCNNDPEALEIFYQLHMLATAGTPYNHSATSQATTFSQLF